MTVKYVQIGESVDYTPSAPVAAGTVVVQGTLLGVTTRPIAANELGSLLVEGVFDFPKAAEDIPAGTACYWDATNERITVQSAGNTYAGKAVAAAAEAAATVLVRLSQ